MSGRSGLSLPYGSMRQVAVCFVSAPPFTEVYPLASNEEGLQKPSAFTVQRLREIACQSLLSSCQLVALLANEFPAVFLCLCLIQRIAYLFAYFR